MVVAACDVSVFHWQIVAREKASNEAKSEFMSLMCHEVRTPLNGCLASAEMLLETVLQVTPQSLCQRSNTKRQQHGVASTLSQD
jgi:signal transduction histidine kinase